MTDQPQPPSEGSAWVVEPPAVDAAIIHLDVERTDLTPELREAIEALARAMEQMPTGGQDAEEEVGAFRAKAPCPKKTVCQPLTTGECYTKTIIDCTIVSCPRAYSL